jgi:predicted nucleic acid-binding protein
MSVYIDANVFVAWEKGKFDLPGWIETNSPDDPVSFPAAVWQELMFGKFAWEKPRAEKRSRFLAAVAHLGVAEFGGQHAERAAGLAAALKLQTIGFSDFQIAASALEDGAELLTFNTEHFRRVPDLKLAKP